MHGWKCFSAVRKKTMEKNFYPYRNYTHNFCYNSPNTFRQNFLFFYQSHNFCYNSPITFKQNFFFFYQSHSITQLLLQPSYYFQTKFFFFTIHTQSHEELWQKLYIFCVIKKKKKKQAVKNSTIPTRLRVAYFEHDGAEWEAGGNVVSYGW